MEGTVQFFGWSWFRVRGCIVGTIMKLLGWARVGLLLLASSVQPEEEGACYDHHTQSNTKTCTGTLICRQSTGSSFRGGSRGRA